ncbi:MAG: prepilin-type N-terminal cleavage/methylation domain-containing protein [Cyanothece sp. SIO2G6]|nr:prepilin-type N-terminal cleavage/methylation domain-containing protein [Cyanothece sp. SIO2G6]
MSIFVKFCLRCLLVTQQWVDDRDYSTQGLTLIELLVVIVIVGILSAIASTSFFNAATRAKGAEASVNLSAILKEQQHYYLVNGEFANHLDDLGLGIQEITTNYHYKVRRGRNPDEDINGNMVSEFAVAFAEPITKVRGYVGKVWLDNFGSEATTKTVLCEGDIGEIAVMDSKLYCPGE